MYTKSDVRKRKFNTEFLTLAEWMRQNIMFDSVSSVDFFKHYVIRKIVIGMYNKVRTKQYLYKRRKLLNSLFITKPC